MIKGYERCLKYDELESNDARCGVDTCGVEQVGWIPNVHLQIDPVKADVLICKGWGRQPTAGYVLSLVGGVLGIVIGTIAIVCFLMIKLC